MEGKRHIDIAALLSWAYLDELAKRQLSSAEGMWNNIREYGANGGMALEHSSSPQRYPVHGAPHPDAKAIEAVVKALPPVWVDWDRSRRALMGVLDPLYEAYQDWQGALYEARRTEAGGIYLVPQPSPQNPLDTAKGFSSSTILWRNAIMRAQPDWERTPEHSNLMPATGGHPVAVALDEHGRYCWARDRRTHRIRTGARCPLVWYPTPRFIAFTRAEYAVWHWALCEVVSRLNAGDGLKEHIATGPAAPAQPWNGTLHFGDVIVADSPPAPRERAGKGYAGAKDDPAILKWRSMS